MATAAEYQITLQLQAGGESEPEAVEDDLVSFIDALIERAGEIALGPTGSIDGDVIKLHFVVTAADLDEMYDKLRTVSKVLGNEVYELTAASAKREPELALV